MPSTVANSGSASSTASSPAASARTGEAAAQHGFGHIENSGQPRRAAAEHESAKANVEHAAVAQVVAQHFEKFAGARLKNFADHALRNHARGPVAHRRHFDFVALRNERDDRVAVSSS